MITKYKGIIFDLDGTLFDSMFAWKSLPSMFLREKNIPAEENIDQKLNELSMQEGANYLIENYNLEMTVDEVLEGVIACMANFYKNDVTFKPFAREFLDYCKENGIKMCIATASDRKLIHPALKRLEIYDYFCDILTCRELDTTKREALIYEKSLEKLGTKKCETLVFEDALYAIKTAISADFHVVSIFDESFASDENEIIKLSKMHIKAYDELLKKDND